MRRRDMQPRGFTLIELMIVVAIVGILAVVSAGAYRRYVASGRKTEVYAMMGEFRAKEEAYRAEFNTYLSTAASESSFYPTPTGSPTAVPVTSRPATWSQLGINPGRGSLYCGYVAIASDPLAPTTPPTGARGLALIPAPTAAWWYVNASCDNDGNSAVNALFTTASTTTSVVETNEGK